METAKLIHDWLEKIQHPRVSQTQPPTKRQKIDCRTWRLPSPAPSGDSSKHLFPALQMDPHTPNKRRLDDEDNEATPRPNKTASNSSRSSFNIRLAPSDSSQSQRSGRSSPVKNFPINGMDGHCIGARTMDPDQFGFPLALEDLMREMSEIGSKNGIVPEYLESEIRKPSQKQRSLKWLTKSAYTPSENFGLKRNNPLPADRLLANVENLTLFGRRCYELQLDEAGWNNEVHIPILQAVFRGDLWPDQAIVDYFPW